MLVIFLYHYVINLPHSFQPQLEAESLKLNLADEDILFITGQKMKYEELKDQIKSNSIKLTWQKIDTEEIQDCDSMNIVRKKCLEARKNCSDHKRVIMVEDVSLNFKGMNDLPGPYIKCG